MISLKPGFTKRLVRTKFLSFIIFLSLIFFVSCNPSLRFAAVKYNAADLNHLLDATKMEYLSLQNSSPDAKSYKKPFTLVSYARTEDGGFIDTVAYDLQPLEGKKPKTFKGKMILGNLVITRQELTELLTEPSTGQRKNYAFLLFTPMFDKGMGYLFFDVKASNSLGMFGDSSAAAQVVLRPCPPATWCRPKVTKTGKIITL